MPVTAAVHKTPFAPGLAAPPLSRVPGFSHPEIGGHPLVDDLRRSAQASLDRQLELMFKVAADRLLAWSEAADTEAQRHAHFDAMRVLGFFLPMVAFVAITLVLGLYVGSALYLFYVAWRHGKHHPLWAAALGIGFSIFMFLIFDVVFKVPLLKGPLEAFLKIY